MQNCKTWAQQPQLFKRAVPHPNSPPQAEEGGAGTSKHFGWPTREVFHCAYHQRGLPLRVTGRPMKLGIVGTGNVGRAIALAATARGSAREIVLVNRTSKLA